MGDHEQWQTLIADDGVWDLACAPAIGHPARLSARAEVLHHVTWFLGAVEDFRFFDARVYAFALVKTPLLLTSRGLPLSRATMASGWQVPWVFDPWRGSLEPSEL